jgi:hypothetical protein
VVSAGKLRKLWVPLSELHSLLSFSAKYDVTSKNRSFELRVYSTLKGNNRCLLREVYEIRTALMRCVVESQRFECQNIWFIYLPLRFRGLKFVFRAAYFKFLSACVQ